MSVQQLMDPARALVAADKGLLAMDESTPTCDKRFAKLGIPKWRAVIAVGDGIPSRAARRGEYSAAMDAAGEDRRKRT